MEAQKQELEQQPNLYSNVEALRQWLKERKPRVTQAEFAKNINYSGAVISRYLKYDYNSGDLEKLNQSVGEYLKAEEAYVTHKPQVKGIALTRQSTDILDAIQYSVEQRCLVVIVGDAGIGKTVTLEEYWRRHERSSILLTLDPTKKSPRTFIPYLWTQLPGMPMYEERLSVSSKTDAIIGYLKGKNLVVLMDDAQWLKLETIELARSIHDQAKTISMVMAGTFSLDQVFGMSGQKIVSEQLYSRVQSYRPVNSKIIKADLVDVIAMYGISDPEIIEWFFRRCNRVGRRYRWICNVINAAYSWCIDHQQPMSVAAIEAAVNRTKLHTEGENAQ